MTDNEQLIMVVDATIERAQNLKELIEFMDVPAVSVAAPDNWQSRIGDRRLAAIFLRNDLPKPELDRIIGDVGKVDPSVPIVLVNEKPHA